MDGVEEDRWCRWVMMMEAVMKMAGDDGGQHSQLGW